jgi:hypothetical protein
MPGSRVAVYEGGRGGPTPTCHDGKASGLTNHFGLNKPIDQTNIRSCQHKVDHDRLKTLELGLSQEATRPFKLKSMELNLVYPPSDFLLAPFQWGMQKSPAPALGVPAQYRAMGWRCSYISQFSMDLVSHYII